MDKSFRNFLIIGKTEGISYLLLLFVAMPMKYIWNMPEAVRIMGMAHGVLFVLFMFSISGLWGQKKFDFKQSFYAFILSLLPFGTFYLKRLIPAQSK